MSRTAGNHDVTQTRSRKGPRIRACRNCAQARARCSGDDVCARCSFKALSCVYPEKRRKKAPSSIPQHQPTWTFGDISQPPNSAAFPPGTYPQPDVLQNAANGTVQPMLNPSSTAHETFPAHVAAGSNYQPQVPGGMEMDLDTVYDPNLDSINWLPTAFNDDLDYATFSGLGMPLQVSSLAAPLSAFTADQMPLDIPQFHDSPRETTSSHTSSDSTGRFYATSVDGARMPFSTQGKRRSINVATAHRIRSFFDRDQSTFAFPQAHLPIDDPSPNLAPSPQLMPGAYERIVGAFKHVCHGLSAPFPPFSTQHLPSHAHFNHFGRLYFEHFHPILPILHPQTLRLDEENWLLALSVAALGCRYADSEDLLETTLPMTEFLRRAVMVEVLTPLIGHTRRRTLTCSQ